MPFMDLSIGGIFFALNKAAYGFRNGFHKRQIDS